MCKYLAVLCATSVPTSLNTRMSLIKEAMSCSSPVIASIPGSMRLRKESRSLSVEDTYNSTDTVGKSKPLKKITSKVNWNSKYLRMNQSAEALVFRCSLFRVVLLLVSNTFLDPKVCFPGKLKRFWGASSRAYLVWQVLGVYKHPLAGVGAENLFDGSHVHSHPAHVTPVL